MARRWGTTPAVAGRIAEKAGVRILHLPGVPTPKYNAADVDRVLAESVGVAGRQAEAS